MKKFTKFPVILIMGLMISINVSAQLSATASATAVIYSALSISCTSNLHFGVIIPSAVAGDVTIAADGTVTRSNNTAHPSSAALESRAVFHVIGEPNEAYDISITDAPITLTGTGATPPTMTISAVLTSKEGVNAGTLSALGTEDIYVGGTLDVGANQAADTYTNANAIVVTINYN